MSAAASPVVRPATPGDVPEIWRLIEGLARYERLEAELEGTAEMLGAHLFGDAAPRVHALIAEVSGRAVGYALVFSAFSSFHTGPLLWLEDLYVEPDQRGTGIGKALMVEVARFARSRGIPRIGWLVLDWNRPSIEFYERLGARPSAGWHIYGIGGEALETLASGDSTATAPGPAGG